MLPLDPAVTELPAHWEDAEAGGRGEDGGHARSQDGEAITHDEELAALQALLVRHGDRRSAERGLTAGRVDVAPDEDVGGLDGGRQLALVLERGVVGTAALRVLVGLNEGPLPLRRFEQLPVDELVSPLDDKVKPLEAVEVALGHEHGEEAVVADVGGRRGHGLSPRA